MENKLELIFIDLNRHQDKFLCSNSGKDFEERINDCFKKHGIDRRIPEHDKILSKYIKNIKPNIIDKLSTELMVNTLGKENPYYKDIFVYQAYGSQNYPDIIYLGEYIIPIEVKFTKDSNSVPMWNGNLPKEKGVYIFGQYKTRRLTYFLGGDVLSHEDRLFMSEKSGAMKSICPPRVTENGFSVYFRETYNQSTSFNYFDEKRESRENNVIAFIKKYETII